MGNTNFGDNMRQALLYARVSTQEQADRQLSIPAQIEAIRKYAEQNDIEIIEEFADEGVSAFHDKGRPQFQYMLERAKRKDIDLILVHDASRFCRDRYASVSYKKTLRSYGASVVAVTMPYDTSTPSGVFLEAIEEARAESEARILAMHTIKGMKQNAVLRDPETGWCYKNGGSPLYGYRSVRTSRGKDSRGKEMFKQIWLLDDDGSPPPCEVAKWIIDSKREKGYKSIALALNTGRNPWGKPIPAKRGNLWSPSTIREMFYWDRLMEYAGYGIWNRSARRDGYRARPKEEWIIVPKAHPAIIDEETVEELSIGTDRRSKCPKIRDRSSRFLLSGHNAYGDFLYRCECEGCTSNMIQASSRDKRWSYYGCAARQYRKVQCDKKHRVRKEEIEQIVINGIFDNFGTPETLERWAREVQEAQKQEMSDIAMQQQILRRERNDLNRRKDNLMRAVEDGLPFEQAKQRLTEIESRLKEIDSIEPLLLSQMPDFDIEYVKSRVDVLKKELSLGGEEARRIIRQFVISVTWFPDKNEHEIVYAFVSDRVVPGAGSAPYPSRKVRVQS